MYVIYPYYREVTTSDCAVTKCKPVDGIKWRPYVCNAVTISVFIHSLRFCMMGLLFIVERGAVLG